MSDPIRYWQTLTTSEAAALAARDPVVILPLAATEQHGPHLPLSTDLDIGLGLLQEAFRQLPPDLPTRVLPPQAVGASREHLRFAGTLSLDPDLVAELIHQHGTVLATIGIRRLVLFNTHGGNLSAMDTAALRLRDEHDMLVVKASYFTFPRSDDVAFPESEWRHGLHGGAAETAMMLHLRPDLVRPDAIECFPSLGEDLQGVLTRVGPESDAAFAWLAGDLNPHGVTGNAQLADAAIGQRLVAHYGRVLAEVILDARTFPLDRLV